MTTVPQHRERILDQFFARALDDDRLGMPVWRQGDRIRLGYPIAVLAAERAA